MKRNIIFFLSLINDYQYKILLYVYSFILDYHIYWKNMAFYSIENGISFFYYLILTFWTSYFFIITISPSYFLMIRLFHIVPLRWSAYDFPNFLFICRPEFASLKSAIKNDSFFKVILRHFNFSYFTFIL